MIGLKIIDIKTFMTQLFVRNDFDQFLLEQAEVVTAAKMTLSGHRNAEWYDTQVWEMMEEDFREWMQWGEIKNMVFSYIKGKRSPDQMRISFQAGRKMAENMLKETGVWEMYCRYQPTLFFQIRYYKNNLILVTGISFSEFHMDKTIEKAWDESVIGWLKKGQIAFETQE